MTSANKVSDLLIAAGEAFTKLGELAQILQSASSDEDDDTFKNHNSSSCWSSRDTELLQLAVKRFGDDLNIISEHIKDKTMCQIKSTFKRLQTNTSGKEDSSGQISYTNSPTKITSSFEELNNLRVPPSSTELITSNRSALLTTTESTTKTNNMTKQSNLSNNTTNSSKITTDTSTLSTQINNSSVPATSSSTASICASPSPFLHYPLLRKSADITLNMLNARDDSDDEDRKAGLSVFNST